MGRGGRMRTEYIDGEPVKRRRVNDSSPPIDEPETNHIDLRVVRYASLESAIDASPWDRFINKLGRDNHALGTALPLGSVAITEFSSQAMNEGLREAYPNDFFSAKKKPGLFRRAKKSIDSFLRERESEHQWKRSEELVAANEMTYEYANGQGIDYSVNGYEMDKDLLAEERQEYHPFGQALFLTSQLSTYGRGRKFGVDLSLDVDGILQEEFRELHNFIGRCVFKGNGIASQRGNAPFHATIFRLHDHVGYPSLDITNNEMPEYFIFDKPQTEIHTVPVK